MLKTISATNIWEFRVQLWNVSQRTTDAEESPPVRFVIRKHLVKTRHMNGHCGELLPSKYYGNRLRRLGVE
jgi:hypothetical protein